MKAILIDGPKQVRIAEVAMPMPEPGEVLIRSRAVGICGSDVELYQGTRPAGTISREVMRFTLLHF